MEEVKLTKRANNLIGKTFGQLKVKEIFGRDKYSHIIWLCECSCGNIAHIKSSELLRKKVPAKSCGCIIKNKNPMKFILRIKQEVNQTLGKDVKKFLDIYGQK